MAISFVGAASAVSTTGQSSWPSALPSGLASNDLILIAVHRAQNYAIGATPTGYTWIENVIDNGTSPSASDADYYYRFADGTETTTGPTFDVGANTTRFILDCGVYRGVDTTTPFIAHGGNTTPSSTADRVGPTLTNTDVNAWAVFHTGMRGVGTPVSFTPPTGMTERLDDDAGTTGTGNSAAEWADTNGTIGSTGSVSYTATASGPTAISVAWTAILKPATGAGPTAGADVAAGVGTATISGPVVVIIGLAATGAGGAAIAGGIVVHSPTVAPLTGAGVGSATVGAAVTKVGTDVAAGVGVATVSARSSFLGTATAAGVGTATVTGTVGIVAPPHIPTQATIFFNGISSAAVLAVPPGGATLATDGTSVAQLANDGTSISTVLAVPAANAIIQTT